MRRRTPIGDVRSGPLYHSVAEILYLFILLCYYLCIHLFVEGRRPSLFTNLLRLCRTTIFWISVILFYGRDFMFVYFITFLLIYF